LKKKYKIDRKSCLKERKNVSALLALTPRGRRGLIREEREPNWKGVIPNHEIQAKPAFFFRKSTT